jgi:hypothetical protein
MEYSWHPFSTNIFSLKRLNRKKKKINGVPKKWEISIYGIPEVFSLKNILATFYS